MADMTKKKQRLAADAARYSVQFVEALQGLLQLKAERSFLESDFADGDFVGTDSAHMSAGTIRTLFDFVVPSLDAAFQDSSNGGRNKQILFQIKK